ncbi:MAG: aminomethyl-transferring glycine dehydrogenase [Planctomycetota bacterium JB042]
MPETDPLAPTDVFRDRHLGPSPADRARMLESLGLGSIDELIDQAVPDSIRMEGTLDVPPARTEREVIEDLRRLSEKNRVFRSFLGLGYHGTVTPPVILRNVFENPGWYTQYTPYQAEIAQGRLEALLNFQTMVTGLTGTAVANSSLLDEATAAAEAMTLCRRVLDRDRDRHVFLVADHCHPQTIEVVKTRAAPLGYEVVVGDPAEFTFDEKVFGVLVQSPTTDGALFDVAPVCDRAHEVGALAVVATDLLALTLLKPPGECGADVVIGSSQRLGVPMWAGGPHAAFMATREEYQRKLPGRIVGVSRDSAGEPALRLALQTREQHIRRDRATSNICTAQVLLAVGASMFGVYHGPEGLTRIARRIHAQTSLLAAAVRELGHELVHDAWFDTLRVRPGGGRDAGSILEAARAREINLRPYADGTVGVTLDQTVEAGDLENLHAAFGGEEGALDAERRLAGISLDLGERARTTSFMTEPVFHAYRTEHELLRYMKRLENRDLSLAHSMISLGSCTMKLNATAEMIPISLRGFRNVHPFAPADQREGYRELIDRLEAWLCSITGFSACSMQPNAGSQGEYAGLLVIRAWHQSRGDADRDVCLIPTSAHGTNPASAVLAGMRVVAVKCDADGNIDLDDLRAKASQHEARLAAIMVTYPSTHGVFEGSIKEICSIVHQHGGQVYLDGANMNAMVGLCRPGDLGGDVCHLNLHKTFCIPHGGGGPGMGPICVAEHLAPFLPSHPVVECGGEDGIGAISAAPFGSPGILPISYAYIAMMGPDGLTEATKTAILAANYVAERLDASFPVLYRGANGRIAHECIVDLRAISKASHVDIDDVAKRLIDYGFHAPTMSWPVAGTLMIEPTESESLAELDRFCEAMIAIRGEIADVEAGRFDADASPLAGAPHTARAVATDAWDRPYSRETAAFPTEWTREAKFWPAVGRIDNVYGDKHLCCTWSPDPADLAAASGES